MQDLLQRLQSANELTASGPIAFDLIHARLRADTVLESMMVFSNLRVQITRQARGNNIRERMPEFHSYRNLRTGSTFI